MLKTQGVLNCPLKAFHEMIMECKIIVLVQSGLHSRTTDLWLCRNTVRTRENHPHLVQCVDEAAR